MLYQVTTFTGSLPFRQHIENAYLNSPVPAVHFRAKMLRAEVSAEDRTVCKEHRATVKIRFVPHNRSQVAVVFYEQLTGISIQIFSPEHVLCTHIAALTRILDLHIDGTRKRFSRKQVRFYCCAEWNHGHCAVGTFQIGNIPVICIDLMNYGRREHEKNNYNKIKI